MTILRSADYVFMPWQNGLGETREIIREPLTGEFAWRLSMATVGERAGFSTFAGVTRVLAVVEGEALSLTVDDVTTVLRRGGASRRFSGEAPAAAEALGAVVTDLNLMTRDGVIGSIEPLSAGRVVPDGEVTLIVDLATLDTHVITEPVDWAGDGYLVRVTR